MKVLVTGAPGWLGNRLLEVLTKGFNGEGPSNNWDIRCLIQNGLDDSFIHTLSKDRKIEKVFGDVTRIEMLTPAVKDVDTVFHLAGIVHPKRIKELYQVNTMGTENLLKACEKYGVKKFIYISSNSAAGTNKSPDVLMKEEDEPNPYFNYGLSKYNAECLVKRYQESTRIETVIIRACWFYGPNQPDRQTTFFRMIKKGNPIIFGDGNNLRSLTYIDNLCQGILLAAENKAANGQIYWIADKRPYATNNIYKTIADLLGIKKYKPLHVPHLVSETFFVLDKILQKIGIYVKEVHVAGEMNKNIACSIEKAERELGYSPEVELKEGMQRSIEWCRQNGIEI